MDTELQSTDILSSVALEFPCNECGGVFRVSLGQILLAKEGMRGTCNARGPRECPGMYYAGLIDDKSGRSLTEAWGRIRAEATRAGGRLVIAVAEDAGGGH